MLEDSEALGKQLRFIRSQMQKARRQLERNIRDGVCDLWPELEKPNDSISTMDWGFEREKGIDDEDADHDFENSIINDYMERSSRCEVRPKEKDVPPAFRDSVLWDRQSEMFLMPREKADVGRARVESNVSATRKRQLSPSAYSASIYSDDQVSMTIWSWMDAHPDKLSEKHHKHLPKWDA